MDHSHLQFSEGTGGGLFYACRSIPLQSAYCAAKHAVAGFSAALRSELIHHKSKVRVTMVELPALNTPQFDSVKSRLSRKAQPVPPIYQPEIAAKAIVFASHHPRREIYVGMPTVKAIIGNKFFAGLLDRYPAPPQGVHREAALVISEKYSL